MVDHEHRLSEKEQVFNARGMPVSSICMPNSSSYQLVSFTRVVIIAVKLKEPAEVYRSINFCEVLGSGFKAEKAEKIKDRIL